MRISASAATEIRRDISVDERRNVVDRRGVSRSFSCRRRENFLDLERLSFRIRAMRARTCVLRRSQSIAHRARFATTGRERLRRRGYAGEREEIRTRAEMAVPARAYTYTRRACKPHAAH